MQGNEHLASVEKCIKEEYLTLDFEGKRYFLFLKRGKEEYYVSESDVIEYWEEGERVFLKIGERLESFDIERHAL